MADVSVAGATHVIMLLLAAADVTVTLPYSL